MDQGALFGLPLPVVLAFVVLLFGLALVAHLLHSLRKPAVIQRTGIRADPRHPDRCG